MSSDELKIAGALKILEVCAQVRKGEEVLVVCDSATESLARILARAAEALEAYPVIAHIIPRSVDGQEPPATVAAAMKAVPVFLTPVSRSITHTQAVRDAVDAGGRGLVLTQWTEDMLIRGGISADFPAIAPTCRRLVEAFAHGNSLTVTAPGGTNLRMDITGRRGNALTCIVEPGEFSPVPTIEANVSPIEGSAEGTWVADVSIPYADIGILESPVHVEIREGFVREIRGAGQARRLREVLESFHDPLSFNIAELGIGMNPNAEVTGFMLEDEAVARTAHLGIGTSITLGGTVKAASHYDLLLWRPTVTVDGRVVVRDGEVIV
jgi:2,5-dihydroxypyridine 5,6-dioxygenase